MLAATLVTREQVAEAVRSRLPLAPALVEGGLDEYVLESFLRGEGFESEDTLEVVHGVLDRLPGTVAQRLWALPLRVEEEGLVVAMADPSDAHVTRELALISGTLLLPRVARLSLLRDALHRAYPDDIPAEDDDDEPDITFELTRPRTPGAGLSRPTEDPSAAPADEVVLLVRPKAATEDASAAPKVNVPEKRFSRPPGVDVPHVSTLPSSPPARLGDVHASDDDPEITIDSFSNTRASLPDADTATANAWGVGARRPAGASIEIDLSDSWDDLDTPSAEVVRPSSAPSLNSVRGGRKSYGRAPVRAPGDIGTTLAQMRTLRDRDAVLTMACEATLLVARAAVFLALRGQVLRGWSGRGGSLTADAVRNLWIPISTPSMFRGVVQDGARYAGPYGVTAADNLFRAATGSRGGVVVVCPVEVMGKTVAVLVADDVRYGEDGTERVETLAQAVGDALKRIILARKG